MSKYDLPKPSTPLKPPPNVHNFQTIKRKEPDQDGGIANDFLGYALPALTLLLTAQYVMTIASMNPNFPMVSFAIFVVMSHAVLVETLLRGLKASSIRMISPWFIVTAVEELVLLGLFVTHMETASVDPEIVALGLFRVKGAYMGLTIVSSCIRYILWGKSLHSVFWKKESYQKI